MSLILLRKKHVNFILISALLLFSYSCQKTEIDGPGNLSLTSLEFIQIHHSEYIDLPDGVYQPSDPNFSMNNPSTWTGNMAQYVVNRYTYAINYEIHNSGSGTAYDSELDLGYFFNSGDDVFETKQAGTISAGGSKQGSFEVISYNRQLEECAGEIYWYDY